MLATLRQIRQRLARQTRDQLLLPSRVAKLETIVAQSLAGPGQPNGSEWGVASQNGEDGVLSVLSDALPDDAHFFVEIGIGRYEECNTRMLCLAHRWRGVAFDLPNVVKRIDVDHYFRAHHPVKFRGHVVNDTNVAHLVGADVPAGQSIGFFSLDIDGQDYWVLEAYLAGTAELPRTIMVEYNAHFGPTLAVTVPRDPTAHRFSLSPTGLVFGASFEAFRQLLSMHGYEPAYVERTGMNALFVQTDLVDDLPPPWRDQVSFKPSIVRQARDRRGEIIIDANAAEVSALVADAPIVILSGDGPQTATLADVDTDFSAYW